MPPRAAGRLRIPESARYDTDSDPELSRLTREQDWADEVEDSDGVNEREVDKWFSQYTAQDEARERQRTARAKAGGDESLFRVMLAADISEPEPVALSKGGLMLSSGVHRVNGPAGDGKTRVAYWEILQRVKAGERWAIYDREMGPARYKQAMIQLGATDDNLADIDYIVTENDVTPDLIRNGRALCRVCIAAGCAGILYDSMTPFLAAAGIAENDPQGVRDWTDAAARPMVNGHGGTAIIIDHTGHKDLERGRGSSDKAAGCDVDMFLSSVTPFAIGMDGAVALTVTKDRSGTLRDGSSIRITARCYESGDMDFEPEQWLVGGSAAAASDVAELLNLLLMKLDVDYATASQLQNTIPGTKKDKLMRIERAVRDHLIIREQAGKSFHYSLPEGK